jgi:hypothetical protein
LEQAVGYTRSRSGILVGLAAAVGAFGAAAMMSAVTAATARADDFTNLVTDIEADYSIGQTALTDASTDFSSAEFAPGLALLFDGVDNDSVVAPENFLIGIGELLTNESLDLTTPFNWSLPSDFSDAVSSAESYFSDGAGDFTQGATALAGGDYGDALMDYAYGLNAIVVDPLQEVLLGAAVSF